MADTFLADFDAYRARRRNQSVGRAQEAITLNSSTAPEQASRAQRDARLLGIPTAAVLGDPMFSAEAKALRDKEYLAQAPAASRWLSDDDNAAVAHDQVQELSSLEQMLRRGVRGGADVLGNIGKSLYAGIPRTSAGVVGLTEALGDVAGALNPFAAAERGLTAAGVLRGPTSEQNRRQTSQAYRQRLMSQAAALRPQTDNPLASAAYSGLESVVPSILGIAATLASGGSATPAAALLAAPVGGEAYGQARDAGKGLAPSLIYGVGQGGAEAVGERIGLGPLFDGLKVGSPFLQTLIKTQISEQLGEQATTVLQDFNEWVTLNPEKTVGQFLQERPNAALQTAIATAVGSAATTTGVYTGNRATQELLSFADRRANAQASRVRAEQFNEAADAAAGNPVRERSPERFEQFLKAAAGAEQVFVPAEQVASFFQSNPDLDQWMDEWDIRDQVNAALVSGADVVFDQSTYLARVAGTPAHEAWKNEIRHGLDAMSMREADEFEKTGEESLRASFDAAVSVAESEAAALAPEARVADDLFSQLRTAGYTADAARTQAALAARAFARRAERSPQRFADAYAAYESAGLTVQQEFPQVIRENLDRIDVMIEALRKGRAAPSEQRMFGRSLMEFLSQEGGVIDTGGELQALGADSWHRPKQGGRAFRRRFIRSAEQGGNAYAPDQAALRAVEAGYLPEGATGNDLFEAVREELAGRPVYSQGFERNTSAINNAAALNELEQLISQLDGVTLESSNAEIKAALERAAAAAPGYEGAETYDQSGRLVTDSEAFRAWFGDSKAVDENGQPLVVYHGTPGPAFEAFDPERAGVTSALWSAIETQRQGFYFTADKDFAQSFANQQRGRGQGALMSVYLSIQNPLDVRDTSNAAVDAMKAVAARAQEIDPSITNPDFIWGQTGGDRFWEVLDDEQGGAAVVQALRESGYDGLRMIEEGADGQDADVWVAFEPTQIKSTENRGAFDPADPRILYQSVPTDQPLYVVHNLSAEGLRNVNALGGLAAPSLAIARGDVGFDSFGEISLVGSPQMANPKGAGVRAFNADVYSPRQPRARFKVDNKAYRALGKIVTPVAQRLGIYSKFDEREVEREGLSAVMSDAAVKAAWLESIGETVPVVNQEIVPPQRVSGFEDFTSEIASEIYDDPAFEPKLRDMYERALAKAEAGNDPSLPARVTAHWLDENGAIREDRVVEIGYRVATANRKVNDFGSRSAQPARVDEWHTAKAIDEAIADRVDQYNEWVRSSFGDVTGSMFFETESGRRKEYTLDNLVREMTRVIRGGEGFNYGAGNIRAEVARQFRTLADVKAARGQIVSADTLEGLKDEVNDELFALADKFKPYHRSGEDFGWGDIFSEFMKDLAKGRISEWQSLIFEKPAPSNLIEEARSFLVRLQDLPTEYFEIKMQRSVALSEFEAAVVPSNLPADARKILTDAGLDLVEYDRGETGDASRQGRQAAIESIGERVYFQNTPFTGPRGQISFSNGQAAIRLFESRDLSTFSHEFAHLTLEMLIDDASDPNASPEVLADMQTVLDWFSREAGRTITINDIGVDQHELWARGSERYLMEGKAPSLALRDVFRTFSTWLKSIYKILRNLNAPITDDVRAVMDRLLASDAEIEQARQTMGVEAGFETAEQAGMTGAEFEVYKARVERARKEAEDSVIERMTRAIRRRVTAEWRTAEDELRPDVIAEVDAMPDVAAVEWLVTSKQGLTKETVVAMLGDEAGVAMLPKRVPPIVRDNGMHPDEVAEIVGYRNGHELLNALMDYEAEKRALVAGGDKRSVRQARIDRLLMERMLDRYGDPLNDGSIEREALDALHSDRRSEILAAELGVLARRSGNSPSPLSAIKDWARGLVGGRPVREARSGKYLRAERTAASATQKALAAGDRQEAFKQKQAQTLNAVLYAEASRAEQYVETAVARLKRLSGRVLSIDIDYRDQIESLLEQYDLREVSGRQVQRRRSLLEFVKEREEAGEPVNVPPELLAAANKTHYSELTVDEFRALDEAVQHLAHLGRLKRKLIVNGEQRDLDRMADEAWTVAQPLPDVKGAAIAGSATSWQKAVRAGAQFEASLVKAQEFFRLLDAGAQDGLFSTVLDRAGQDAAARKLDLSEAFWRPVVEAERAIPNKVKNKWTDTLEGHPLRNPQNGETVELKRRDLIGLARHTGTLSNFEKMAKGWGVIEQDADAYAVASARDQFIAWLDGQMDATEWLYVQAQWDAHERLRPEYFAVARKVEGFEPEAVEAAPLPVTSAGPLAGGYAPISYHPDYDAQAQRREQRDAGSIFGDMLTAGPRPDNGATNSRMSYVGPVKIALEDGRYAAEKQLTYTAYAEYVTNSLKFLRHPVVRQTMIAKLGVEAYNTFEPWIAGQVRDESVVDPSAHPMVKIARQARSNMTAAVLLGSFTVLAAQPGGQAQAIAYNGAAGQARGVANATRMAQQGTLYPYITGLSDFMRARVEQGDLDRDYRLAMQRAQGATGGIEKATAVSGKAIALVDFYTVSAPTWLAAYDKALSEGKDEATAVYLADKAVRITQGGGRAIDQSGIMRANEVTKMVTFAYSWANALYNMQRAAIVDFKNGNDRLHNAIRLMAVLVLPAIFDAVLSGDTPDAGDDPEEAIKNAVGWFARNVFFGAFAGIPIVRDVAGGAERMAQGKYVGSLGQTAMGRIADSVLALGNDAWAAVDDEKEVSRRWPAHVINATGLALGLPGTAQTARTFNYVQDVNEGKQNPDSVLDWMNGLLRGPQDDQK